jgi:hypothetical protein
LCTRSSTSGSSTLPAVVPGPAQVSAEALTSRIRQIASLPVNHTGMRVEDMDAAIAWHWAVLNFDLIDGPVQARVRPRRLIHRREVLG